MHWRSIEAYHRRAKRSAQVAAVTAGFGGRRASDDQ